MAEQLTLDLPVRTALGREDFFVSTANEAAIARIDATESWPGRKLILVGPSGAGKTHLAHVWADAEGGHVMGVSDLQNLDPTTRRSALAIDDVDQISANAEEALFHLHNHMARLGLPLLLTAQLPPSQWAVQLPDLASRMQASDVVQIDAPDDALLAAMLVKLFTDRQLAVAPALIPWLVTRSERSFASIQRLVAALDAAALSEKRAISQNLAAAVLDKMGKDAR